MLIAEQQAAPMRLESIMCAVHAVLLTSVLCTQPPARAATTRPDTIQSAAVLKLMRQLSEPSPFQPCGAETEVLIERRVSADLLIALAHYGAPRDVVERSCLLRLLGTLKDPVAIPGLEAHFRSTPSYERDFSAFVAGWDQEFGYFVTHLDEWTALERPWYAFFCRNPRSGSEPRLQERRIEILGQWFMSSDASEELTRVADSADHATTHRLLAALLVLERGAEFDRGKLDTLAARVAREDPVTLNWCAQRHPHDWILPHLAGLLDNKEVAERAAYTLRSLTFGAAILHGETHLRPGFSLGAASRRELAESLLKTRLAVAPDPYWLRNNLQCWYFDSDPVVAEVVLPQLLRFPELYEYVASCLRPSMVPARRDATLKLAQELDRLSGNSPAVRRELEWKGARAVPWETAVVQPDIDLPVH